MLIQSDAAFKKEENTGYALGGATYLRVGVNRAGEQCQHLLNWDCKSSSLVTRSTYAAELLRACQSADHNIPLAIQLQELRYGPVGPRRAMQLRQGGLLFSIVLDVDARSVFESVKAGHMKMPQENSLFGHLAWLRELVIRQRLIRTLRWVDTRDMSADALTKGAAPRDRLFEAMAGKLCLRHPMEGFTPVRNPKSCSQGKVLPDGDNDEAQHSPGASVGA